MGKMKKMAFFISIFTFGTTIVLIFLEGVLSFPIVSIADHISNRKNTTFILYEQWLVTIKKQLVAF
ncbi:MAG: hypothetical protein IJ163_02495 [Bacteroidaceae bacterium]|nr:hypothetical protein [Bacteroidaceae bacterium]